MTDSRLSGEQLDSLVVGTPLQSLATEQLDSLVVGTPLQSLSGMMIEVVTTNYAIDLSHHHALFAELLSRPGLTGGKHIYSAEVPLAGRPSGQHAWYSELPPL